MDNLSIQAFKRLTFWKIESHFGVNDGMDEKGPRILLLNRAVWLSVALICLYE